VQGQVYDHCSAPVHDGLDLALRDTILVMSDDVGIGNDLLLISAVSPEGMRANG
jgi:hypothetical protein